MTLVSLARFEPKMAVCIPQLGGHHFEFVGKVSDRLKCAICLAPLKDPMQVMNCGHRFCKVCIGPILRKKVKNGKYRKRAECPIDRKPFSVNKVFEDNACQKELQDLHVKCPSQACSWTGELRTVKAHEETCAFVMVKCSNTGCEQKVLRSGLLHHMANDCKWRTVVCFFCKTKYPWTSTQAHKDSCVCYPVACVNQCGTRGIRRNKMTAHLQVCPAALIPCKYEHVGCKVKSRRDTLQTHLKESMEQHLDLACAKLTQLVNTVTRIEDRCLAAPFVWKISHFEMHIERAKLGFNLPCMYSDPFYSSPQGCKMRVMLYPASGKGTHVSIYIQVVKGAYDNILSWPFEGRITITLIDQQEDEIERINFSRSITPKPTANNNFNKPITEQNVGLGYPEFFSHELVRSRRYIVDSAIFLKVEVE